MEISIWRIQELTGYVPKTTFFEDFSIAEMFGIEAVKDTYKRCFSEWKTNHIYLTELVMSLNWKIWEHYSKNEELADLYTDLWYKADLWACNNLKGQELQYYYTTTD